MKIRLLSDYKIGSRIRGMGTVLDVDAELGNELINAGIAGDAAEKTSKKKKKNNV